MNRRTSNIFILRGVWHHRLAARSRFNNTVRHHRAMTAIHLIKKTDVGLPPIDPVAGAPHTFTSGYWTLSRETARSLIGGKIYFHEHQRDPSFYGGRILDAQRMVDGDYSDKIVFTFLFSSDCRDVRTTADGWAQEMKIVL